MLQDLINRRLKYTSTRGSLSADRLMERRFNASVSRWRPVASAAAFSTGTTKPRTQAEGPSSE
jgi:hypothetical protein